MNVRREFFVGMDVVIHEFQEEGHRLLRSLFTVNGSRIIWHRFGVMGMKNTEIMALVSQEIDKATYEDILARDVGFGASISTYPNNKLRRVTINISHVIEDGQQFDDVDTMTLLLSDGRRIELSSDSPPPFVESMSVTEFGPIKSSSDA